MIRCCDQRCPYRVGITPGVAVCVGCANCSHRAPEREVIFRIKDRDQSICHGHIQHRKQPRVILQTHILRICKLAEYACTLRAGVLAVKATYFGLLRGSSCAVDPSETLRLIEIRFPLCTVQRRRAFGAEL